MNSAQGPAARGAPESGYVVRGFFRKLRGMLFADPAIILATIVYGTISIVVSFFDEHGTTQAKIARAWARTLLRVSGVRVTVEGLQHIDPSASYVFVANHESYMDSPAVLAHVPAEFRFLAKQGLFQIPFLGTHLGRAGHIPVLRGDPRASVKTMQTAAEKIRQNSISLLIFPEGGRSHDGVLQAFKEGGAYIAIKAGAPLVPVAIIGTAKVLPYGGRFPVPGSVRMRILKPIQTTALTLKDRTKVTEDIRASIAQELDADSAGLTTTGLG